MRRKAPGVRPRRRAGQTAPKRPLPAGCTSARKKPQVMAGSEWWHRTALVFFETAHTFIITVLTPQGRRRRLMRRRHPRLPRPPRPRRGRHQRHACRVSVVCIGCLPCVSFACSSCPTADVGANPKACILPCCAAAAATTSKQELEDAADDLYGPPRLFNEEGSSQFFSGGECLRLCAVMQTDAAPTQPALHGSSRLTHIHRARSAVVSAVHGAEAAGRVRPGALSCVVLAARAAR
jgi:hypothetical protein